MMVNLLVVLDERFSAQASARERVQLETAGYVVTVRDGADDRTLAWIDEVFGGTWSGEAFDSTNVVVTHHGAPVAFASVHPRNPRFAWLRGEAAKPGTGIFGPFGVDPPHRSTGIGASVLTMALCELRTQGFARALIGAAGDHLVAYYERVAGAVTVERFEPLQHLKRPPRTVIMASGSGTNAQAVIDAARAGLPLDLVAVISNKADAGVLLRAKNAGMSAEAVVWDRTSESRDAYDTRLLSVVHAYQPDLVLLLGWMHLLDARFVAAFPELLNIHPAFLPHDLSRDDVGMPDGYAIPAFRGGNAVRDALAASSSWIGASFHAVTMETDRGTILTRKPLRVEPGLDAPALLEQLHPLEHGVVLGGIKRWLFERP
jgi:phosphoribosylglycinamide formyltransferase 1